jgi:hypothetical protein
MDSMQEELSSLINKQTWNLVNLPPGRKATRSGWINKAKKNEHGAVNRLQSRLVEKPGIDYNETFAPVGDKVILRFVLSRALHLGYDFFSWTSTLPIYMGTFHLWPQKIGKRMVLSNPKFSEIHWIRNLSKRIMLAG